MYCDYHKHRDEVYIFDYMCIYLLHTNWITYIIRSYIARVVNYKKFLKIIQMIRTIKKNYNGVVENYIIIYVKLKHKNIAK